jgi:hypothetical protein
MFLLYKKLFWTAAVLVTGTGGRHVETGVKGIEVLGIQLILHRAERFTESLEVHDLPGAKETNGVGNLRHILYHAQDIVVSGTSFLLWCNFVRTTIRIKIRSSNEFR